MQIHRIYTHSSLRNFTYILVDESEENAYCIDPYDASQVIDFLRPRGLKLHAIINTHEHWDHTRGNAQLVEEYGAKIYVSEGARNKIPGADFFLQSGDVFSFPDNIDVRVLETPGHTAAHICLLVQEEKRPYAVFSGDTLFHAGVGNCNKGGNAEVLFQTVRDTFYDMPDDVVLYPGHDYVETNLRFTLTYEPENADARKLLQEVKLLQQREEFYSGTIAIERKMNLFFRCSNPSLSLLHSLEKQFTQGQSKEALQVFLELRKLRDKW